MASSGYDYFGVGPESPSGGAGASNPAVDAPRVTLKGTFHSTRYPIGVKGSLVLTMRHVLDAAVPEPYNTRAWITFTGGYRNGKTKRLKLVIGTMEGVTCAMDSTVRFKMFINRVTHTTRGGWRVKGRYERVDPDDSGRFSLREVFEDDDFSTDDDEDRTSALSSVSGLDCSVM